MFNNFLKKSAILAVAVCGVAQAGALTGYGLTDENDLLVFDTSTPGDLSAGGAITGLGGQDLIGIDFRPSNGLLYGVGNFGGIFTINTSTFAATQVATLSGATLSGSRFGFDFNPVVDRLRIVSDTDQSLAVNVSTGVATVNGAVSAAGLENVTSSAYTNNFAGATATTLYGINVAGSGNANLVTQNTATGALTTVGSLGNSFSSLSGFDIYSANGANTAFAILQNRADGVSGLYSINLGTGTATSLGLVGGGDLFDGFAIQGAPVPEPASMVALGLGAAAMIRRRRNRKA